MSTPEHALVIGLAAPIFASDFAHLADEVALGKINRADVHSPRNWNGLLTTKSFTAFPE